MNSTNRAPTRRARRRAVTRWLLRAYLLMAAPARSKDAGMSTAEYAVGTIAAAAFAAILYQVITGGSIITALGNLIQRALNTLG